VSPKGPNKKDTDKIKFFKIDPSGDIAPAFPAEGGPKEPAALEDSTNADANRKTNSNINPEPEIFILDEGLSQELEIIKALPSPDTSFKQDEELDRLRPQVEDISHISDNQELTVDQGEILKKYINLKEAEVRDVREQQRQYQTILKTLSTQVEQLTVRNREMLTELEGIKRREENLRNETLALKDRHQKEILLLRNDYEEKLRKSGNYEAQMQDLATNREEWRQKVKEDLKRIRLKERELENKYELLKRDTQALLDSKDKHVLELKKKNDALELELESLEERLRKGNTILGAIDSKKRRLIETLKLAVSLLEGIDNAEKDSDSGERKTG
jgi:chromosome segregation ATPase